MASLSLLNFVAPPQIGLVLSSVPASPQAPERITDRVAGTYPNAYYHTVGRDSTPSLVAIVQWLLRPRHRFGGAQPLGRGAEQARYVRGLEEHPTKAERTLP